MKYNINNGNERRNLIHAINGIKYELDCVNFIAYDNTKKSFIWSNTIVDIFYSNCDICPEIEAEIVNECLSLKIKGGDDETHLYFVKLTKRTPSENADNDELFEIFNSAFNIQLSL